MQCQAHRSSRSSCARNVASRAARPSSKPAVQEVERSVSDAVPSTISTKRTQSTASGARDRSESSSDTNKLEPRTADASTPESSAFPARYKLVLSCMTAFIICNMDKVNMSVAILPMSQQFGWSASVAGLVQSSFFWGYMLSQVPRQQVLRPVAAARRRRRLEWLHRRRAPPHLHRPHAVRGPCCGRLRRGRRPVGRQRSCSEVCATKRARARHLHHLRRPPHRLHPRPPAGAPPHHHLRLGGCILCLWRPRPRLGRRLPDPRRHGLSGMGRDALHAALRRGGHRRRHDGAVPRVPAQRPDARAHVHALLQQLVPLHDARVAADVLHADDGPRHRGGLDGIAVPVDRRRRRVVGGGAGGGPPHRGRNASAACAAARTVRRLPCTCPLPHRRRNPPGLVRQHSVHLARARPQQLRALRPVLHTPGHVQAVRRAAARPDQHVWRRAGHRRRRRRRRPPRRDRQLAACALRAHHRLLPRRHLCVRALRQQRGAGLLG
eukprot:jgi/Ulvmu1/11398/UM075_0060.1